MEDQTKEDTIMVQLVQFDPPADGVAHALCCLVDPAPAARQVGCTVILSQRALRQLSTLPAEQDGHFDGDDIHWGGERYLVFEAEWDGGAFGPNDQAVRAFLDQIRSLGWDQVQQIKRLSGKNNTLILGARSSVFSAAEEAGGQAIIGRIKAAVEDAIMDMEDRIEVTVDLGRGYLTHALGATAFAIAAAGTGYGPVVSDPAFVDVEALTCATQEVMGLSMPAREH